MTQLFVDFYGLTWMTKSATSNSEEPFPCIPPSDSTHSHPDLSSAAPGSMERRACQMYLSPSPHNSQIYYEANLWN